MLPAAIATASLATAAFAGYHSLAWRSQLYGRTFIGTPGHGRKLALTYDDGPNDPDTPLLLDILAKHNVKTTFFLIGKYVQQRPDIVRRIISEGHQVGNHTFNHPNLAFNNSRQLLNEFLRCEGALLIAKGEVTGQGREGYESGISDADSLDTVERILAMEEGSEVQRPSVKISSRSSAEDVQRAKYLRQLTGTRLFRPPFGARRPATLRIARELGYTPIMWSVTCFDWKSTTADRVERHATRQIRGGDIILMHDGGHKQLGTNRRHTIEATDRILTRYKSEGFEFVTVPEMDGFTTSSV